jgi:hypothetical protein
MTKAIAICTAALLAAATTSAQESQTKPQEAETTPGKRLRVEFRETRERGQSTAATQLSTLALHADAKPARIFVGTLVRYTVVDRDAPTTTFRNAGVDGRVTVTTLPDGRYRVDARLEKASVLVPSAGTTASAAGDNPVLLVVRGESKLAIREGETVPFASAVDPVTGEVVRIDVTVTAPPAANGGSTAGGAHVRLRALLVLTRRQGEKTIARRPYTVTLQAGGEDTSRVFGGSMLPVQTEIQGKAGVALRDVGAGLKLSADRIPDGRYRLDVGFSDGVLAEGKDSPQVRTFESESQVFVQVGETVTIASAVDPHTGEVVEADVTLEGLK